MADEPEALLAPPAPDRLNAELKKEPEVNKLFRMVMKYEGSDLHLKVGLPPSIEKLCNYSEGLVILAGVTGSGKSTTIASMLDYVNEREPLHILTVEDPIEFTYTDKKSYINQREIGLDSRDWHKALKDAVRQDPDVILIGELRDVETFEAAVHSAETGHLVFGTIHAAGSPTTLNRILDLFPAEKHGP